MIREQTPNKMSIRESDNFQTEGNEDFIDQINKPFKITVNQNAVMTDQGQEQVSEVKTNHQIIAEQIR